MADCPHENVTVHATWPAWHPARVEQGELVVDWGVGLGERPAIEDVVCHQCGERDLQGSYFLAEWPG